MRLRTEKIVASLGELLWQLFGKNLGEFGNNDDVTFFQPHLQKGRCSLTDLIDVIDISRGGGDCSRGIKIKIPTDS
jgi:hypothetical protein